MRKRVLIVMLLALLVGCSKSSDNLQAYKGMSTAQIFHGGETALAKGNYPGAVKYLEALDAIYPFGRYAEQGQLDIIYVYYKNDDTPSALVAADRYIRLYPRGKHVDYAYYMKGLMSFQLGFTWLQRKFHSDPAPRDLSYKKQAFLAFSQIVHFFPRSHYAGSAALHMAIIRNIVAHKNVLIAQYYMKRKAYVAASNRASYVVQHFNTSPQLIPALAIMVKAYRALNLTEMADNTLKIFQASYPHSKELKKLLRS